MKAPRTFSNVGPLTRTTLRGVWAALIVPWNDRDQVDLRRLAQEVRGYAGTGVHGVYTGGTPSPLSQESSLRRSSGCWALSQA